MESNYKISQNEKVSVWRFSLNPFAILMVISLCITGIAYGQATVKTTPIINEDGIIQISKDETVTITVMNAVIGETYRLRDDDSKTIIQTVIAESDIVKFEKLIFNKTGTMNYRVFDLSLALLVDLNVEVNKKPQTTESK